MLIAILSACGRSGGPTVAQACATAAAALPPIRAAAGKPTAETAARSADTTLTTLSDALGGIDSQGAATSDLINLRSGVAALAIEYRNLAALLSQPGSGLIGPLRTVGLFAYGQVDRAGAHLGTSSCSAMALGRPLFIALAARTVAPAGPNLATAGTAACQNITVAYGRSQIAIDALAADAQLERSAAALDAAANDLSAVHTAGGVHLRAEIMRASELLGAGTVAVAHGTPPALTTTTVFRRATAVLAAAFRSAGVRCAVPGA